MKSQSSPKVVIKNGRPLSQLLDKVMIIQQPLSKFFLKHEEDEYIFLMLFQLYFLDMVVSGRILFEGYRL